MSNIITPIIVVPDGIGSYHGVITLKSRLIKKCMRKNKLPTDHSLTESFSYFSVPGTVNDAKPADEERQRAPRMRIDEFIDDLNDLINDDDFDNDNFDNANNIAQREVVRPPAAVFNRDITTITKINMIAGENQASDIDINNFWQTINQLNERTIKIKNVLDKTNTEKIKIITALKELYRIMYERLNTILNTLAVNEKNRETYIFSFIGRGYMVYEAILESPDLAMFFIQNENNAMPAYITELVNKFNE